MSSVKLINHSIDIENPQKSMLDMVAYVARVSNPESQLKDMNNEKLVNYLIRNHHWSPFEMVQICLEINTTRDIARQILRHRSFSFQEFSQRYAQVDYKPIIRQARLQDTKNRQNSIETENTDLMDEWNGKQQEISDMVKRNYEWALQNGIAKEQARCILPEGNTPSRLYMSGTLRSWIHYIELRSGNGTQKEHKEIAIECANEISKKFPMILDFVQKE